MTVASVVRNDWSTITVPALGDWRPSLRVSVVIPAYENQASLDLTLASLSRQTYPDDLLEVIVVDDGSRPPLRLPSIRPTTTRLISASPDGSAWGIAHATNVGARAAHGEIILRLDSDMVVFPEHVEAHARWHHQVPYAVTLGEKRFVDVHPDRPGWPTPEDVVSVGAPQLFAERTTEPHGHIEELLASTDQLRAADHLVFRACVGATVAVRREMFERVGGFDPTLRRGSDTEFGYRLLQAGAVFVPETAARSWHLGRSNMMRDRTMMLRYSRAFIADVMPHPRWLRSLGGSAWAVPLVVVVMEVGDQPLERVRTAVDSVLHSDEKDVRVLLVGDWAKLADEPRRVLDDPLLDLRLVAATYRSDPRVRFVDTPPETAFPSPYLLRIPAGVGLTRWAINRLIDEADRHQAGLVSVPVAGAERMVRLWRTAALGRVQWLGPTAGPRVADRVAETYGARTLPAHDAGVVDLADVPLDRLTAGFGPITTASGSLRWLPSTVEVGGVRSLARATALVARLSAHRIGAQVRRWIRRSVRA